MQQSDTLHLLVSSESQAQMEACVGVFRDAGWSTRAHRVTSLRDLSDMLRDPQWDLLIASDKHPELAPAEAIATLAKASHPLPCIVRTASPGNEQGSAWMRAGARDVIANDQGERLLLAALREITALREHRELETLRGRYEEVARRVELLLAASQDAIAYIVDGMHVHANELYAKTFGYADIDELASIPLVDLIAAEKQQSFKDALRRYRDNPAEQTSLDITAVRADGSEISGKLVLSTASFEGEPCMQVLVRALSVAAAIAPAAPAANAAAGSIYALADLLSAAAGGQLLLISVDAYPQHCRNLGVHDASRLVDELGEFIARSNQWPQLQRTGDATLALVLTGSSPEQALNQLQAAVGLVAGHIHEIGEQSVTGSISAIVCPLDDASDSSMSALIDRAWSALLLAAERGQALRGADPARAELLASGPVVVAAAPDSEQALIDALQASEFQLMFQPMISLRGDSSEYYEVQVLHAASKQSAAQWLQDAQLNDHSLDLDQWVVTQALKKLAAHRHRNPDTRLIVPLGSGSVLDADFATWLAAALRTAELPADSLVLQITHRAVNRALKQAKELAERVRALGCQLAVTDVHSANNPIPDLAHLQPAFARIDTTLAQALTDSDATNTLLKPLIESLHQEQIASIMPGVEGAGVMAVLWQLGVNFIQGNYLQAATTEMQYEFTELT